MATGDAPPMLDKNPLLILMDGHAMVYRAWHAIQQPLNVRRTGEEVRAVAAFEKAVAADPAYRQARQMLAQLYRKQGRAVEANKVEP